MAALADSGGLAISIGHERPSEVREAGAAGSHEEPNAMTRTVDGIFRRHLDPIYRFIYRQVGNHHDAEDLASEVFLKAARGVDTSRAEEAIESWLFSVSRSVIADHWRKHYRLPPLVDVDALELPAIWPGESRPRTINSTVEKVEQVLASLPERQAQLLRLRFLHGYTVAETAQELGITVSNAKVIQHRALAAAVRLAEEPS